MKRLLLSGAAALVLSGASPAPADRAAERERMVLMVENLAATAGTPDVKRISAPVLAAMRKVPRHLMVPAEMQAHAYENRPLPIGHEATISQPYIVALMTHLLRVERGHKVLEVGTGSGYQAAILAEMGARVRSIEIVEPLARDAAARLSALGYAAVTVQAGDGYAGWPSEAPFDRIIVTAAAAEIPSPLVRQLRPGGRMVIPVARPGREEQLMLVEKDSKGRIRSRSIIPVRFVPLVRATA